ncbi:unnamed protein product [Rotaria sordida]|uniref:Uncharacterized protein n=1 Tax=Rotaria sordida TaxID=392033 RepID=A0A815QZF8_9BILA|nr:unnamed protein product [Rotaria sordida]CAF1469821.1 unnamed protein product [Rotaria sordida]CAF3524897.1 unnamed protein product [Rotaria sordida]CAF3576730.1 unnamed protein product [Rotaria sordida]
MAAADSTSDVSSSFLYNIHNKYHVLLVYMIEVNGIYYGAYYEPTLNVIGTVQNQTFESMVDEAYESLACIVEEELDEQPFDVDIIEDVVVFDLLSVNTEEFDIFMEARSNRSTFEDIYNIILGEQD